MAIKYIEEAEKRAELARQKYGKQTLGEILSRIIIYTLIGYMAIVVVCVILYFSPANDRLLSTILLIFVLVEMLTEYALWMFTYQGMRKTEAPLQDLQQFSTITKEGWRRAEMVLDWTAPFFEWADGIVKRSGLDWRQRKPEDKIVAKPAVQPEDVVTLLNNIAREIESISTRMTKIEQKKQPDGTGVEDEL